MVRSFFRKFAWFALLLVVGFSYWVQQSFAATCAFGVGESCLDSSKVTYCNEKNPTNSRYCSLEAGKELVKNEITGIEKEKTFFDYVQTIAVYIIGFLFVIGVLYIVYAGFGVLTSAGDEEKVKKAKKTIISIIIGLLLIFLASAIVSFMVGQGDEKGLFNSMRLVEDTYAADTTDSSIAGTFDDYKNRFEEIGTTIDREYRVDESLKVTTLNILRSLVIDSTATLPDNEKSYNMALANNVITTIDIAKKKLNSDSAVSALSVALNEYIKNVRVGRITGKATASPDSGNAPLTVTLRANDVRDPSGVVIPAGKYIWWTKNTNGTKNVIATGPSTTYVFKEERNYTVFLDVVSASRNSRGKTDVLPLRTQVEVKVLPRLGNIVLYANGTNISGLDRYKVTPAAARAGIIFDATSSQAMGGARIVSTRWDFGNGETANYETTPRLERRLYYANGIFRVSLSIKTNEGDVVTKQFELIVQDPIASVRADRYEGYANEDFRFQATMNAVNIPLTYLWEVIEPDTNNTLYSSKNAIITYKFPRMGRYFVRLKTTTPNGQQDTDTVTVNINSKSPVASFESRTQSAETPNTFYFDATKSYDPDSLDISKLTFAWSVDGVRVDLDDSDRNGSTGKYTFTTLGNHTVSLEVSNPQGKMSSTVRSFSVDSLLSVRLIVTPKISQIGGTVTAIAESKEASVFEWDFGDGTTNLSGDSRMTHTYKKAGVFPIKLTVRGNNVGGSNTITRNAYIADADSPFAAIKVMGAGNAEILPTPGLCDGNEAFAIDRSAPFRISGVDSVNVDGTTTGLTYTWKYAGKSSTQQEFSYKPDDLGCFPVTLTVRSSKNGKVHTSNTYMHVGNLLPTFSYMNVTAARTDTDPVIVNVSAENAVDADGAIVSYLWYYYTDSDTEPQDFRITRTNKTSFVLPRINGKYYFAVVMEDSNGEKVNSETIREDKASITLASDNINTPLVSLKLSNSNVIVGESVKVSASAKNVLQQDITTASEYKWDYDGDGFYDETTKTGDISHVYSKPGTYNLKVKVTYKGISNTKYQVITVSNNLLPSFEYFAIGRKFAFLNTTTGSASKVTWKLSNGVTSESKDTFMYTFAQDEEPGTLTLEVTDGKDTKTVSAEIRKDTLNETRLKRNTDNVVLFAWPRIDADRTIHISQSGDRAFVYAGESKLSPSRFVIDNDIRTDSDLNGDPADDADNKGTDSYDNGGAFLLPDVQIKERTVRISTYDAAGKLLGTSDIKVVIDSFGGAVVADNSGAINEAMKDITVADKANLDALMNLIQTKAPEQDRLKMTQYVSSIKENWFDAREKTRVIIDFENYLSALSMDQSAKDQMIKLLDGFLISDSQTQDDVTLAVNVLKSLIPDSNEHYKEIVGEDGKSGIIGEILSHPTNIALNKELGKKILEYIKNDANIETKDKLLIKSQLETIIYGGQANIPANQQVATTETTESSGILGFILGFVQFFGIILGLLVAVIALLYAYFKVSNKNGSLSFQDYIIERIFHRGQDSEGGVPPSRPTPVAPSVVVPETIIPQSPSAVEDPLAHMTAPVVSDVSEEEVVTETTPEEGTVSEETFQPNSETVAIPSWLSGVSTEVVPAQEENVVAEQEEIVPENTDIVEDFTETTNASESDLPDWLRGSSQTSEEVLISSEAEVTSSDTEEAFVPEITQSEATEEVFVPEIAEPEVVEETVTIPPSDIVQEVEELPSWLSGLNATELTEEISEELAEEKVVPEKEIIPEQMNEEIVPAAPVTAPSDDIPDWLRAVVVPAPADTPESTEQAASEAESLDTVVEASHEEVSEEVHSEDVTKKKPKKPSSKSHLKKIEVDEDLSVAEEISIETIEETIVPEESSISASVEDASEEVPTKPKRRPATKKTSVQDSPITASDDLPDWLK